MVAPNHAYRIGRALQKVEDLLILTRATSKQVIDALGEIQVIEEEEFGEILEEVRSWIDYIKQYYKAISPLDSEDRKALLEDLESWSKKVEEII